MSKPQRSPNRIAVLSWRLDSEALSPEAAWALLSPDETVRGGGYATALLRRRFAAGRARLRLLLGQHLDLDPRGIVFVLNAFGKPSVAQAPSFHFSLSHSADRAVLALSDTLEVGADIERVRPLGHIDLARRYFHAGEIAAIEGLPPGCGQVRAFFRLWTLKEAVVKALGKGLSIPLDSFEVSIATASPVLSVVPEDAPRTWWLESTAPEDGYCRALAVPVPDGAAADIELIQRTA